MRDRLQLAITTLSILAFLGIGNSRWLAHAAADSAADTHTAIDTYIRERMEELEIPGAALAIVQGDQIEYVQGYGVADPTGRAVTPQTPFLLASVSKSFTALAILQLAEKGRLDLDAPVRKYVEWFQIADEKAAPEITVRQLLYQTSGFTETDGNRLTLNSSLAEDALAASMKRLGNTELMHAPGTAFEYSNINYGLLGAIVEAVSGHPFETYVQQNIFAPLEMQHSYVSLPDAETNGAAQGYYPFFGVPVPFNQWMPYSRAVTPWAGIFSGAEDLAHYLIAHLNEGRYQNNTILSPEGMARLHRPGIEIDRWSGYAMGWWVGPAFDLGLQEPADNLSSYTIPIAVFHEGSWANFRTLALMLPEEKLGIVLLMNTNDPAITSVYSLVGWDIASIYVGNQASYYPPAENVILQNARSILLGVLIGLLASLIWFIRRLQTLRQDATAGSRIGASGRGRILGYVVLPLVIDVFVAWYLLAKQLPDARATVLVALRTAPDMGLMLILILLLALGWGTVRTVLMLQTLLQQAKVQHSTGEVERVTGAATSSSV